MHITFLGAAQEVTGSAYLVEAETARFLVDCGLFQGGAAEREKNTRNWAFDVKTLDFVLITHAHLDHCGLLPRLVAQGFRGPVYATPATADLMAIMLADSAHIMQKEAERPHATGTARSPLYSVVDAERAMASVRRIDYGQMTQAHRDVRFQFADAGHILGSAIVEAWIAERGGTHKLVCSGDLGARDQPLMRDPARVTSADTLLVESTYGDRRHRSLPATLDELVEVIDATIHQRRGNVIIPAFAVGRTQELISILVGEARRGRIRDVDVFIDSPLASRATEITLKHQHLLDDESRENLRHAFSEAGQHAKTSSLRVHVVESVEESKMLNDRARGAVIIAGSGMCDGGRIKHHLLRNLGRPECAVLFGGFQARGTLGRRIVDRSEWVRIYGQRVDVRASVHTLGGLSAHADRDGLLAWLRGFNAPPNHTYVVHGEHDTALAFAATIHQTLGWPTNAPEPFIRAEIV